jgi:hypothetical protein
MRDFIRITRGLVGVGVLAFLWTGAATAQAPSELTNLYSIDQLPRFRPFTKVGSFSSYDRSGGNDDGFSGKYSYLRKVDGALVIAEIEGPGVITRIHTPTPTDDPVEFVFDGESTPRLVLPLRDLFSGKHSPFTAPLTGHAVGGYYSYVPLQFKKSIQIRVRAPKMQFYQINYALYPRDANVLTYDPSRVQFQADIERIRHNLESDRLAELKPAVERHEQVLRSGESVTLFDHARPGRIVGLKLSSAASFAGRGRTLMLRATWDGGSTPAISCPVGDLFGYGFGQPASESLLFGTQDDKDYFYFPMPFDRSARIEIVAEPGSGPPLRFDSEVYWTPEGRHPDEGRFYALWERESPVPQGKPFTFVETQGRGHLAGVILQAQGLEPGQTSFFEGDDEATLDGELTVHGTGSEDFFNGGWYDVAGRWYERVSMPLSGALIYDKPSARTGGYRILMADAYSFRKSLKFTIEHGPEGNLVPANYTAVSFLYLQQPPTTAPTVLESPKNTTSTVKRLAFIPGWNQPIYAFSMDNMTLTKTEEKLPSQETVRFLSITAHGEESFGPHYIAFTLNMPEAGEYEVSVEGVSGPQYGTLQLLLNDQPVGDLAHFASAERHSSGPIRLATMKMRNGENHVFFRVGSEKTDTGAVHVDLIKIICDPK